jgi:acetyltransferase-like isoleucine patch superfamily enzyme
MNKLTRYIFNRVKSIEFIREIILALFYFLNKSRKNIRGLNNIVVIDTSNAIPFFSNVFFDIVGDDNLVVIKSGTQIHNTKVSIRGSRHKLIIEENCRIKGGCLWFDDDDCQITIGKGTTIGEAQIGVTEPNSSITLGQDCMLARGIEIRSGDSHSIIDLASEKRINHAKNVKIGNHVWIGKHASILKGVSIGSNSIIGIRSVVTKDIPENCIAVGLPAKVAKSGVNWIREKILPKNEEL